MIATIITTHMPRNEAAEPGDVWPGIRIHILDIVQPPGIGIPPLLTSTRTRARSTPRG